MRIKLTTSTLGIKAGTVVDVDEHTANRLCSNGHASRNVPPDPEADDAPTSVKAILTEVGDDKEKAAAYLETELAGENRSTLVSKLQGIVNADEV